MTLERASRPRRGAYLRVGLALAALLAMPAIVRALPPFPAELPQDPAVYAEWVCYPLRQFAAFGACGCAFPGACGDRAPAGCYCDDRCLSEGDCCVDAAIACAIEIDRPSPLQ